MAGPAPAAMPVGSSPAAFAEAIVDSVLKKANKAPRVKSAQQQELVPVFMNVDYVKEPQERHVRETLLWRRNVPQANPMNAAVKYIMQQPQLEMTNKCISAVSQQFEESIRPFQNWRSPGPDKLVELKVFVRREGWVFRDVLTWDLSCALSTPERYAATVVADLRLDPGWYDPLVAYLQQRLTEARQELLQHPADVQLQPPPKKVKLDAPPTYTPSAVTAHGAVAAGSDPHEQQQQGKDGSSSSSSSSGAAKTVLLPCVLKDDGTDDWEAERQAARAPLLQKWAAEEAVKVQQQQQAAAALAALSNSPMPGHGGSPAAAQQQHHQQQHHQQQQHQQQQARPLGVPTSLAREAVAAGAAAAGGASQPRMAMVQSLGGPAPGGLQQQQQQQQHFHQQQYQQRPQQ